MNSVKIGITGHQYLKDTSVWTWISSEMASILVGVNENLIGISCLAVGSDSIFADLILQFGGQLYAVIPFQEYELKFTTGVDRSTYHRLLSSATHVEILQKDTSEEEAYFYAGKRVVDQADFLVAVWDGKPAAGLGGTGDIVNYARKIDKHVYQLDPILRESYNVTL